MVVKLQFRFLLFFGLIFNGCSSAGNETVPDTKPAAADVYKEQLAELKEPEGMLEKERFFAKKSFLEEQAGLLSDATLSLEKAIKLNPNVGLYHFRLAKLYQKQNLLENALVSAEKAVNFGNASEDMLLLIGELLLQNKEYEQGLFYLEERFIGLPESPELLFIKGSLYFGHGDTAMAIDILEKAVTMGSQNSIMKLARYYLKRDPQKSIDLVAKSPVKNDSLELVALQARLELGQVELADSIANSLENTGPLQQLTLARIYRDAELLAKALDRYQSILQLDSTNETAKRELDELIRNIAYLQNTGESDSLDSAAIKSTQSDSVSNNE